MEKPILSSKSARRKLRELGLSGSIELIFFLEDDVIYPIWHNKENRLLLPAFKDHEYEFKPKRSNFVGDAKNGDIFMYALSSYEVVIRGREVEITEVPFIYKESQAQSVASLYGYNGEHCVFKTLKATIGALDIPFWCFENQKTKTRFAFAVCPLDLIRSEFSNNGFSKIEDVKHGDIVFAGGFLTKFELIEKSPFFDINKEMALIVRYHSR